jgi:DNA-binding transcriptional ArsR family regulator
MEGIGADQEAGAFRALADPTRRQILEELRAGELSSGDNAWRFQISGPSDSRQLGVLNTALQIP